MSRPKHLRRTKRAVIFGTIASLAMLTGCSSGHKDKHATQPSSPSSGAPTSAVPTYVPAKVQAALLPPNEVGKGFFALPKIADQFKDQQAPLCSLTGLKLPPSSLAKIRQITNGATGGDNIQYVQFVATYSTAKGAADAYSAISQKLAACPAKHHVPAKQLDGGRTQYGHDDTWKVQPSDNVTGWAHTRSVEQQTYDRGISKKNIFHNFYDYAVRGNLLIASVYQARTDPGGSDKAIAQRSTEILTSQLGKFG